MVVKLMSINDGFQDDAARGRWKKERENPLRKDPDIRNVAFYYAVEDRGRNISFLTTLGATVGPELNLKEYAEKIRKGLEKIEW